MLTFIKCHLAKLYLKNQPTIKISPLPINTNRGPSSNRAHHPHRARQIQISRAAPLHPARTRSGFVLTRTHTWATRGHAQPAIWREARLAPSVSPACPGFRHALCRAPVAPALVSRDYARHVYRGPKAERVRARWRGHVATLRSAIIRKVVFIADAVCLRWYYAQEEHVECFVVARAGFCVQKGCDSVRNLKTDSNLDWRRQHESCQYGNFYFKQPMTSCTLYNVNKDCVRLQLIVYPI